MKIDEKTIEKMFDSVYGDSIDKDSWTYEMIRDGFKNAINLLLPIIQKQDEAINIYANKYAWNGTHINPDDYWFDETQGHFTGGKLARSTKQEVSDMIKRLGGEG